MPTPDELFERHPVDHLQRVQHNLTRDIDSKRQELRTMVGERYRDLMEAADTIARMAENTKDMMEAVEAARRKGAEMGAATNNAGILASQVSTVDANDPNAPYLAIAAEIKLLMAAPEMIWSAVDSGEFLRASQLFLFARHVHTGLTLDDARPGGGVSAAQIAAWFPVVSRQWASIAHFHDAILSGCRKTLLGWDEAEDAAAERCIEALAALVLLKGLDTGELFQEVMALRRTALEEQLKEDAQTSTAKTLISNSIRLIRSTLSIVRSAFVSSDLSSALKGDSARTPTLSLFQTKQSPVLKRHLTPIVRDFAPSLLKPFDDLDQAFVAGSATSWLDGVHGIVTEQTAKILAHVKSISALAGIRKSVYDLLGEQSGGKDNDSAFLAVTGKDLNLWDEFYRGVFRDRTEALVASQVAGSVYCVQSGIDSAESVLAEEADLSEFLWSDGGVVPSVQIGPRKQQTKPSPMEMKAKGFSPLVQKIVAQFDSTLERMLQDLSLYVRTDEKDEVKREIAFILEQPDLKAKNHPFDLYADNDHILIFVQQAVSDKFSEMLGHIRTKYVDREDTVVGALLFLGRFYQAVPELCPNLERSVLAPTLLAQRPKPELMYHHRSNAKTDPAWTELKAKLDFESVRAFGKWTGKLAKLLEVNLEAAFFGSDDDLFKILPAWDDISISEQGEDGTALQSTIRVPLHLSIALSCCLHDHCDAVYAVAPHSLPLKVQTSVSQTAVGVVAAAYTNLASRGDLSQTVALQLLFDTQFVSQCMVSRENADVARTVKSAASAFESCVDPFDLSVFAPHMATRMKRAVLREQGTLGALIPQDRFNLLASLKSSLPPAAGSGSQQEHNAVLTVGHRPDKIPLVPVPRATAAASGKRRREQQAATSNRLTAASIQQHEGSVSPMSGRRKQDVGTSPSAAKLAAGSFFEAMSTSWFGGK